MQFPRLVLAGSHSGSGKTTASLGLMAALTRLGLSVQPFKVGPDYIDPTFHHVATGRPSHNLDAWLTPEKALRALFRSHAVNGQQGLSLIEGVMGLYDGLDASAFCSTAHVAALLQAPALLIINAEGLSLSAAALVSGFVSFRPRSTGRHPALDNLAVKGVLLNRVAGERHYALLRRCIEEQTGIPCLGFFPKNSVPPLPHRHLGLIPADEQQDLRAHIELLAQVVEQHLDLTRLLELARSAPPLPDSALPTSPAPRAEPSSPVTSFTFHSKLPAKAHLRIGLARDQAFSFYYQDNLDCLQELGAELVFFSPLQDAALPSNLDGLYLGGGFPEIFAAHLEANRAFRGCLKAALESGLPAYAECGGMLYLCSSLLPVSRQGREPPRHFAMVGFFPERAEMTSRLQPFGYVTVTLEQDCLLGPVGTRFPAHEFHYSRLLEPALSESPARLATEEENARPPDPAPNDCGPIMRVEKQDGRAWPGGLQKKNVLAWYPHLHFRGCPEAARCFMETCRSWKLSAEAFV